MNHFLYVQTDYEAIPDQVVENLVMERFSEAERSGGGTGADRQDSEFIVKVVPTKEQLQELANAVKSELLVDGPVTVSFDSWYLDENDELDFYRDPKNEMSVEA